MKLRLGSILAALVLQIGCVTNQPATDDHAAGPQDMDWNYVSASEDEVMSTGYSAAQFGLLSEEVQSYVNDGSIIGGELIVIHRTGVLFHEVFG